MIISGIFGLLLLFACVLAGVRAVSFWLMSGSRK